MYGFNAFAETAYAELVSSGAVATAAAAEAGAAAEAANGVNCRRVAPASDITAGNWTASGGGALYAAVDEFPPDAADYIQSGSNPTNDVCEVKLGAPSSPPSTASDFWVEYNVIGSGSGTLDTALYCGTTLIAGPWSQDFSAANYSRLVTAAQAASIADYADLRVRLTAN